jgi:uncharacterized integral membrane protein
VSQIVVFLALVFSIVIAIFAVQNTTAVTVQFLTFHADSVAVSVLVLISAALGALAMLLLGIAREVPIRWRHRSVSNQLKAAHSRIAELEKAQTPPAVAPPPPAAAPAALTGTAAETPPPLASSREEAR